MFWNCQSEIIGQSCATLCTLGSSEQKRHNDLRLSDSSIRLTPSLTRSNYTLSCNQSATLSFHSRYYEACRINNDGDEIDIT